MREGVKTTVREGRIGGYCRGGGSEGHCQGGSEGHCQGSRNRRPGKKEVGKGGRKVGSR